MRHSFIRMKMNEYHKKENNLELFSIIWLNLHFNTNDNQKTDEKLRLIIKQF